jgi:hypothetical protein
MMTTQTMPNDNEIEKGTKVYLPNGQEAIYECGVAGAILIREIIETEEGEELSDVVVARKVFLSPPTEKIAMEVRKLVDQTEKLRAELVKLNSEMAATKTESKTVLAEASKRKGLEHLEDFIAGRISHVMIVEYGSASIAPWGITSGVDDEFDTHKGLKLLTLFGKSGGDLTWGLNKYSDGSGPNKEIFLYTSESDAVTGLRDYLSIRWSEWRESKNRLPFHFGTLIESAKNAGIEVPEDVRLSYSQYIREGHLKNVETAKLGLRKAEDALSDFEREPGDGK